MRGLNAENTFVITLPKRRDRLKKCRENLDQHGVKYSVWDAIEMKDGRKGLIETMREVFIYSQVKRFDRVLIFEDDAKILDPAFIETATVAIDQLPKEFDLLYLGCNIAGKCSRYNSNLLSGDGFYASHAILYSHMAIEKILMCIDLNDVYDIMLVKEVQKYGHSFCTYPLLVTQENGYSDILKRSVNYEKFIDKRYIQKTKHL